MQKECLEVIIGSKTRVPSKLARPVTKETLYIGFNLKFNFSKTFSGQRLIRFKKFSLNFERKFSSRTRTYSTIMPNTTSEQKMIEENLREGRVLQSHTRSQRDISSRPRLDTPVLSAHGSESDDLQYNTPHVGLLTASSSKRDILADLENAESVVVAFETKFQDVPDWQNSIENMSQLINGTLQGIETRIKESQQLGASQYN